MVLRQLIRLGCKMHYKELRFLYSTHKYPLLINTRFLRSYLRHEVSSADVQQSALTEHWTNMLEKAGIPDPDYSVKWIAEHVHKLIDEGKISNLKSSDTKCLFETEFTKLCRQRLAREPVQYVIGDWDFRFINLIMRPPVFIPRPETEGLVELINEHLASNSANSRRRILEIGCGTGAISLSLAQENSMVHCTAVDISADAVALSKENALRLDLSSRVEIHQCSVASVKHLIKDNKFDVVVSNPPYIPSKDMEELQPEIANFEDHTALHGGQDGLDVIRDILSIASQVLQPDGTLWLEVDSSHPPMIEELVENQYKDKLIYLGTHNDIYTRPRFCQLQNHPGSS